MQLTVAMKPEVKLSQPLRTSLIEKDKEFKLRPYQREAISEIYQFFKAKKSGMLYAPTGAGKTVMALKMISDAVGRGRRVLFCCHRTKLIYQTKKTLEKQGIHCGVIFGKRPDLYDPDAPVQIAMIQTLQNRELPENIEFVIFDEAHSSIYWKISKQIIDKYSGGLLFNSPCYFLGLTATPWRTQKNEGYCQFFQFCVRCPDPIELIKQGFLTPPRLYGHGGILDFSKLELRNGDYTKESLKAVLDYEYNCHVVAKSLDFIRGKKGILVAASVSQCEQLCQMFNEEGIKSKIIVGDTSEFLREQFFNNLRTGKINLICSVNCLCEGFDEPSLEYIIIARPTHSKAMLIQICGRGLRRHPDKKEVLLLDFGECFKRLGRPTSKLQISLCPGRKRNDNYGTMKECPSCHTYVSIFAQICPECGYSFSDDYGDNYPEEIDTFYPEFGELLDPEEEKQLKYVRSQMKTKFKRKQNPFKVKHNFYKKFGYFAHDDWFVGAIFGEGIRYDYNLQIYSDFLYQINPKATERWVKAMINLEFGKFSKTYKSSNSKYEYNPSGFNPKKRHWWEIFNINPDAPWGQIKNAYRELSKIYHPDLVGDKESESKMKIINNAYDLAKLERGK